LGSPHYVDLEPTAYAVRVVTTAVVQQYNVVYRGFRTNHTMLNPLREFLASSFSPQLESAAPLLALLAYGGTGTGTRIPS
jgi:hypothetical protein